MTDPETAEPASAHGWATATHQAGATPAATPPDPPAPRGPLRPEPEADVAPVGAGTRPSQRLLWWDLVVVAVYAYCLVVVGVDASGRPSGTGAAQGQVGLLAVFLAVYVGTGRAVLRRRSRTAPPRAADAVFAGACVAFVGLGAALAPELATVQAFVYPVVWVLARRYATAVLGSVVVASVTAAGLLVSLHRLGQTAPWREALSVGVVSLGFALALGTWIDRTVREGERQRQDAEHLRAAQGEIARLSQAAGAAVERERLSRDLHDTLTQTLTGLVMLAEQAERAFDAGDTARARDRVARLGSVARDAVAEARALVATTHPLGDGGLEAAIGRVVASLRADTGLRVDCVLDEVPPDREQQVVLLRAAQEGLANARKHARATSVRVTLDRERTATVTDLSEAAATTTGPVVPPADRDTVLLTVEDDGVGPGAALDHGTWGMGLSGLAERVRTVGGSLRLVPGARTGTRLEVRLPLDASTWSTTDEADAS